MEKELRVPFGALVCGLVVLILLAAPKLAMIPFVTGIVLLINKQLLFKEWYRLEVERASILRIVNKWLDFQIDQIVIGAVVLTIAQIILAVLSVTPGLRLDQQQAYAWVFYALNFVELVMIFLMPVGHVQLRWSRMSPSGRVGVFALFFLLASVFFLFVGAPLLYITGPIASVGGGILMIGLLKIDPKQKHGTILLAFVFVTLLAIAALFGNQNSGGLYMATVVIAVVETFVAAAFAVVGGLVIFLDWWYEDPPKHDRAM